MICKNCGNPVDAAKMKCSVCGTPVGPMTGGVGFWDLAGGAPAPAVAPEPATAYIPEPMADMEPEYGRDYSEALPAAPTNENKRNPVVLAVAIVLALSLVLNVVLLVLLLKSRDDSDSRPGQSQNRDEDEDDEDSESEDTSGGKPLDGVLNPEKPTDPEESASVEDQPSDPAFEITKDPGDEVLKENSNIMFTAGATGENLTYTWQIWDSVLNDFVDIDFEVYSYLYVDENHLPGESRLYFNKEHGVANEEGIFTWYRCVITDEDGNMLETKEACFARSEEDLATMKQAWEEAEKEREATDATEATEGTGVNIGGGY